MLLFPIIAALAGLPLVIAALRRDRRGSADYAFALGLSLLALEALSIGMLANPSHAGIHLWARFRLGLLALIPAPWLWFSLAYSRGNAGEYLKRWRWPLWGALLLPVALFTGGHAFLVEEQLRATTTEAAVPVLGLAGFGLYLVDLVGAVLVLSNLERTFRSATGTLRWRIKLTILGLTVLFGCRFYTGSQALLDRSIQPPLELLNSGALILACALVAWSWFRTRVFAIDIYPSPAVLRHSIALVLAGAYLLVVGALARRVDLLGASSPLPAQAMVVLVALVILALVLGSDRLRQYLRSFVSNHLHRPRYDYRRIWQTLSQRLSPQFTVPDLCTALVRWTSDNLEALSVTAWVVDTNYPRIDIGGSTSLSRDQRPEPLLADSDFAAFEAEVLKQHVPLDLERAAGSWAESVQRRNPSQFPDRGGHRWLIPLVTANRLLGLLVIGDRVNGMSFTLEDLDLLKCVGEQAAGSLLTLRLSQDLGKAMELGAFQTMAAFFVHDLKNTATTLSLMLQNLPRHFDNPEFRVDALTSLRACVQRIDHHVARLSFLRKGLDLNPQQADLNRLVETALDPLLHTAGSRITRDLHPLPEIQIDPDHALSVITNLVLNALEATHGDGTVHVATAPKTSGVELKVTDTGCGMTTEFIAHSLFRPFQTTKKKGTGLGLYQCKMIMEAHGGRIDVESRLGMGSTVRVLFPRPA